MPSNITGEMDANDAIINESGLTLLSVSTRWRYAPHVLRSLGALMDSNDDKPGALVCFDMANTTQALQDDQQGQS